MSSAHAAWLLAMLWSLPLHSVRAESSPGQLLILRSDPTPHNPTLQGHVDAALEAALASSGFNRPTVSPVPLEELEFATGCTRKTPECLRQVSAALDAEWILIRTLAADSVGNYQLGLLAQHGADRRQLRSATGTLDPTDQKAPDKLVRELVRLVFPGRAREPAPTPTPATPKAVAPPPVLAVQALPPISQADLLTPEPSDLRLTPPAEAAQQRRRERRGLKIAGWSTVGSAVALFAAGIGLGIASNHKQNAYEHTTVDSPETAAQALALHDRAERLTHAANSVLYATAGVAALGVSLLIWDGVREHRKQRAMSLSVRYASSGVLLQLQGNLGRSGK